jgi:hypothetical protein
MTKKTRITTARDNKSCPRSTQTTNPSSTLYGPCVGEQWPDLRAEDVSWPDTGGVFVKYQSVPQSTGVARSLTVRVRVKTRVVVIAFLTLVVSYAMYQGEPSLVRDALHVIGISSKEPSASESPPVAVERAQRNGRHHGTK